ncbi:helix-turn-helix transcriptional regulator [Pseudodesulfovibrio sp.]|uniref:helix-turn-helix domain-containing protein n=1 Tax=Pseudodesulfovibrio sp. TaxID=2035812 RepID=UPI00263439F5|nr:helix-turn-helix transcriptional regulator [Pseudodesulfovibrio sp.]MDD3310976.1 helix-turn-helix transcriptional regulator [Pseudodesulfovibrio sp.]
MTQAEIAELLNEKPHRVNAIMCGKQRVPEDFLIRFVEIFQVDANWLLLGAGPVPELNSREAALVANYRASPEEGKRSLETTSALLAQSQTKALKKAE